MILAEIFGTRKASFVETPVLDDGYKDLAVDLNGSHRGAGRLRGGKYSIFDGETYEGPAIATHTNTKLGNPNESQLYNLSLAIGQQKNVAAENLDILKRMYRQLE